MKYIVFQQPEASKYPVALLSKSLRKLELQDLVQGIEADTVCYSIPNVKTLKKAEMDLYIKQLFPMLCQLRTEYLLVTDAPLFKYLTKAAQAERFLGYVLPCKIKDYEHFHVIYMPSAAALLRDTNTYPKVVQALKALAAHRSGKYLPPGSTIIHFEEYPQTVSEIQVWLAKLLDEPLAIDIETLSLKHFSAGIGTITLCWNQHEGIAFNVDLWRTPQEAATIRSLLKNFFIERTAKTLYHRAWFDVYVLIYQLFMKDTLDTKGLLQGLKVMLRNWDDTQLIRYLATNSCSGNHLSLKDVAQEYAGNYAVDVVDITKVPLTKLLQYNLVDGLSTWYAYNKHYGTMVADQQEDIYENLFKPCMHDIIQMQLTGLPLNMETVKRNKKLMQDDADNALQTVLQSSYVFQLNQLIAKRWAEKRNQELKVKRVTPADCPDTFNINSNQQLQMLLYTVMGLPVIETTDSGEPATGMETIEKLQKHTKDPHVQSVLDGLVRFKQVDKILTSFIPAFEEAHQAPDGWHYLYGNFNLGGTLSGRLSSSDPNLQNLPSTGSKYAKLVKEMFQAPPGKLFVGLDFSSLEDRISALTTKDPNKLAVYVQGFDGHSLRAAYYFSEKMPGIDITSPASVNTVAKLYKKLRQDSKAPTFALTYQGTWRTLMTNCGFTEEQAKLIEKRYHELYVVSDRWVQAKLDQAAIDGYVTVAFGLRLRTPMMKQSVMNSRVTPYEAVAEGRTAGNALGQSYCMLNSRAGMEFMQRVRQSKYRLSIRPCAQIHDAQYFLIDDSIDQVEWVNTHLVQCAQWQQLPEIAHPTVKLGGELSVFHPNWSNELVLPNGANQSQILQLAKEHMQ